MDVTTISVDKETKQRLQSHRRKLGRLQETWDDLINRLLDDNAVPGTLSGYLDVTRLGVSA